MTNSGIDGTCEWSPGLCRLYALTQIKIAKFWRDLLAFLSENHKRNKNKKTKSAQGLRSDSVISTGGFAFFLFDTARSKVSRAEVA